MYNYFYTLTIKIIGSPKPVIGEGNECFLNFTTSNAIFIKITFLSSIMSTYSSTTTCFYLTKIS